MKNIQALIFAIVYLCLYNSAVYGQNCIPNALDLTPGYLFGQSDIDKDGKTEMLTYSGTNIIIYKLTAQREYYQFNRLPILQNGYTPIGLVDINNDGQDDLIYNYWDNNNTRKLFADTTFLHETVIDSSRSIRIIKSGTQISRFLVTDWNNDGLKDVIGFTQQANTKGYIIVQQPNYQFSCIDSSKVFGDMVFITHNTADNYPDLIAHTPSTPTTSDGFALFKNTTGVKITGQTYICSTPSRMQLAKVTDFNHDGITDLTIMEDAVNWLDIYPGTAAGGFGPQHRDTLDTHQTLYSGYFFKDEDNDGQEDLYVLNDSCMTVFKGNINGNYGPVLGVNNNCRIAASHPYLYIDVTSDFDNDGIPDVTWYSGPNSYIWLYQLFGGNTLANFQMKIGDATGDYLSQLKDWDGNGLSDQLEERDGYKNGFSYKATAIAKQITDYHFTLFYSELPIGLIPVILNNKSDFDGDGVEELLFQKGTDSIFIYKVHGGGMDSLPSYSFKVAGGASSKLFFTSDQNLDGKLDLVVVLITSPISVATYFGAGNCTLSAAITSSINSYQTPIYFGDINKNKIGDVIMSYGGTTSDLGIGSTNGHFSFAQGSFPCQNMNFGDLDGNAYQDFVAKSDSGPPNYTYCMNVTMNSASGVSNIQLFNRNQAAQNPTFIDINNDGYTDIVGNAGSLSSVYLNNHNSTFTYYPHEIACANLSSGTGMRFKDSKGAESLLVTYKSIITSKLYPSCKLPDPVYLCKGKNILLSSTERTGVHVNWSTGATTRSLLVDTAGTYSYVVISDSANCQLLADTIHVVQVNCDSVYPGDADENLTVDQYDLLPIGILYNKTGEPRIQQGNLWQGYAANDWGINLNGADYKFADCNGDSIIDALDTLAIGQNFANTHVARLQSGQTIQSGTSLLHFNVLSSSFQAGDTVKVAAILGDSLHPVTNFYGFGTTISASFPQMLAGSLQFKFIPSFLGSPSDSLLTLIKNTGASFACAAVRTNHMDVEGYGPVGLLSFVLAPGFHTGSTLQIATSTGTLTDQYGTYSSIGASTSTFNIAYTGLASPTEVGYFHLYPNPAGDRLTIEIETTVENASITFYDFEGRKLDQHNQLQSGLNSINTQEVVSGMYYYEITNHAQRIANGKLVIVH